MLSPLDDMLWHQLPTTFDHVGTSDPRFFDRYWFAVYDPTGAYALQLTMGCYSNMNVMDAGLVLAASGQQRNLRVSRSLRPRFVSQCGPLEVEVIRPLEHLRLIVRGGPHQVEADMDWRAVGPPEEERPHFERKLGRVVQEYQRFNQIGEVSGSLCLDGNEVRVERWWSCRDHSWGVRPDIGVPEPVTSADSSQSGAAFLFAFLFFSTERYAGHVQVMEKAGTARYMTGLIRDRRSGAECAANAINLSVAFQRGTRRVERATFRVELANGETMELIADAMGPSIAMPGLGYGTTSLGFEGGWSDGNGLGAWRGDEHLETEVWDFRGPNEVVWPDGSVHRPAHRIQPVSVRTDDADRGTGSLTLIAAGVLPQFGLHDEAIA